MFDFINNINSLHIVWAGLLHLASIISVLLTLLLISQILRSPRVPAASIGWLIAIILVPFVGIPLYLLFGERKFNVRLMQKNRLDLHETLDTYDYSLNRLLVSLGIPSATADTQVSFHKDGRRSWEALTALLEDAQHSIDIAIFILGNDAIGKKILEILERKARQGIRVRLLLDGVGCLSLPRKNLAPIMRQGGQLAWFIPVLHRPLRGRTNLRNHRKIVIADQQKVWSGGRNIAAEYLGPACSDDCWIDLSFTQQGSLVITYREIFEADWQFATHKPAPDQIAAISTGPQPEQLHRSGDDKQTGEDKERTLVQVIPSGPDVANDPIYAAIVMACYEADQQIMIVTPYYVPDSGVQQALTLAALRGVEVDLVLPEISNHRLADIARSRYLRELAESGANIWLLPDRMIHAKVILMDNHFAMAGSANMDIRSLFLNCEVMSGFYSKADIQWLHDWVELLRDQSIRHKPQPAGRFREMLEGLTLLGAYQL